MGLIARVLSFVRVIRKGANLSDVKIDSGGGPLVTAEHYAPMGDDAYPLNTDYAVVVSLPQKGRFVTVGYIDPKNEQLAAAGEKRLYSRNAGGDAVAHCWLKNSGQVVFYNSSGSITLDQNGAIIGQNGAGSFELQAGGDFVVNGVVITAAGAVVVPSSLNVNGKQLAEHTHSQGNDSNGDAQQDTGPNN